MGGPFQEMGAAASAKKPKVDPWSRTNSKDRFSGANSMNPQAYAVERSKSPAPKRDHTPMRATRPVSVPKKERPTPKNPLTPAAGKAKQPPTTPAAATAAGGSKTSPGESQHSGRVASGGRNVPAAASAFAQSNKSRFDSGPGSFYVNPDRAAPGVGTFNPDDGPNAFGSRSKSPGGMAKPSPGMAPTNKGRFDGPGSVYSAAGSAKKAAKKGGGSPSARAAKASEDAAADEWARKLGLGAIASAKAAPILKEVDAAREQAEASAAQARAEKEAAEAEAAEAIKKATWMSTRAQELVAAAEERAEHIASEAAAAAAERQTLADALEDAHAEMERAQAEAAELRAQLSKVPARKLNPKPDGKVIDRRPVRLRGQIDADAEDKAAKAEERKAKREAHFQEQEKARLEKEDKIKTEQLEKSKAALSGRRPSSNSRRASGPPPPPDALKGFALVLPSHDRPAARADDEGGASERPASSKRSSASARAMAAHPLGAPQASASRERTAASPHKPSPLKAPHQRPTASPLKLAHAIDVSDDAEPHSTSLSARGAPPPVQPPASASVHGADDAAVLVGGVDEWPTEREAFADSGDDDGHPTGVSSAHHSPSSAAASSDEMPSDSPLALSLSGKLHVPMPDAFVDSSADFAAAEAQAEAQASGEAPRAAASSVANALGAMKERHGAPSSPALDKLLGSMRDDSDWASAKAAMVESAARQHDDDIIDADDGSAHAAADAALRAVLGDAAPVGKDHLFGRNGALSRESSFSGGLHRSLSESMGALPHDAFLSKLATAEQAPTSPGGMKGRMPNARGLFSRGAVAVS